MSIRSVSLPLALGIACGGAEPVAEQPPEPVASAPISAAPALVDRGPELLVERPPDPDQVPSCEVLLYKHDEDIDEANIDWVYRLQLSMPDANGRSTLQRVLFGGPWPEIPASAETASSRIWEVDSARRMLDGERFLYVNQHLVDWTVWPPSFSFVAPRMDKPEQLGRYQLSANARLAGKDSYPKEAWGGCMLTLTGPGGGGCAILRDLRGDCIARYETRHGLGAP